MFKSLFSSKLFKRTLSALVLAPLFLYVLWLGEFALLVWLLVAFGISLYEWYFLAKKTSFFLPAMVLGVMYMIISFSSFFALREVYSLNVLLFFIIMVWMSDIGAYFTGKIIGGPKLIQKISPNKTWAGFVGAMICPAVFAGIWVNFMGLHPEFADNGKIILTFLALFLGLAVGSVGQAGDLLISFVKRQANVKDTGALIPGHGGVLDRIDSTLLGAPVFLILLTLMSYVF